MALEQTPILAGSYRTFGTLFLFIAVLIIIIFRARPKAAPDIETARAMEKAGNIAARTQKVFHDILEPTRPNTLYMLLLTDDIHEYGMRFDRQHPDFEKMKGLCKHDAVRFSFQKTPIAGLDKHEAVAYLRLDP